MADPTFLSGGHTANPRDTIWLVEQRILGALNDGGGADGIKRYTAYVSQAGTDNPAVTVFDNTLGGTLTWTRVSDGVWTTTSAGLFTSAAKTWVMFPLKSDVGADVTWTDVNTITISGIADDVAVNDPIEIRVYP